MSDRHDWMWAGALGALARAERLHRQLFQPAAPGAGQPSWEPPIDLLETEHEVLVIAALPGVAVDEVQAVIEGSCLLIAGRRTLPDALRSAVIHRLELPQGRFERRIPLPCSVYDRLSSTMVDGCLVISLGKRA